VHLCRGTKKSSKSSIGFKGSVDCSK
jgi:hypothetical protein